MSKSPPFIPYGRQCIEAEDLAAVRRVLESDWLTTGPAVDAFEALLADTCGTRHAVAVSSGTAALHCAVHAAGIKPGDEVIVPAMTFAATANAVVHEGGTPVFCDVDADTLLLDPEAAEALVTPRTRAVIAVDYAGQPCDYDRLHELCRRHDLTLIADACHALGARHRGRPAGSLADLSVFSFHPVKHITTGEGGMVVTDRGDLTEAMRRFRNHGIDADHRRRTRENTWEYSMVELGYNYRITDLQCALGISQLKRLPSWLERRREIAGRYARAFSSLSGITPLAQRPDSEHAWHLYVVRTPAHQRTDLFKSLREQGIGAGVHYLPVHLHPYYRRRHGTAPGLCPRAEAAYPEILSLPLFPAMTDDEMNRVIKVTTGSLRE